MKNMHRCRIISRIHYLATILGALVLPTILYAQGPPPQLPAPPTNVKVVNTPMEPIPVKGTVSVSTDPSQPLPVSGSVTVSGSVEVSNAGTSPLLVKEVGVSAKTPVHLTGKCTSNSDCGLGVALYTVPAGKLLVIEQVGTRVITSPGIRGRWIIQSCLTAPCILPGDIINPPTDRRLYQYLNPTLPAESWFFDLTNAQATEKVIIYAGPQTAVSAYGQCSGIGASCSMFLTASGYLINYP